MFQRYSSRRQADHGARFLALPKRTIAAASRVFLLLPLCCWPWVTPSLAHDAPLGWSYPYSCCSGIDCRPVQTRAVSEKSQGYVINTTGEVVPYSDARVKPSPDGEFHWCSVAGADDSRTICLFVPSRSY